MTHEDAREILGVKVGASFDEIKAWGEVQDWSLRAASDGLAPHGHSLYVNTLAERGLFGFAVLMLVLIAWAAALAAAVPRKDAPPLDWALFGAALAGWLVTVIVGLVNTTLHHEHGILAVLLLGLLLGRRHAAMGADIPAVIESAEPAAPL